MRKTTKLLATAAFLSAVCAFTAFAEWEHDDNGYRYRNDSGSYASGQMMVIDGATYAFNQASYMLTGWQQIDGKWYYFHPESGAQLTGWQQVDGKWYYMDPATGQMRTSWLQIGANRYYLDESGVMKTGYFGVGGLAYQADENGVIYRNKSTEDENGNIYVYDDEGRIKFANTSTRNISKGEGGSAFQDFLPPEFFEEGKAQLIEQSNQVISNKKDELYVKYRKKLLNVKKATSIARRRTEWEASATRALEALKVSAEEIQAYIKQVENNTYQAYGDLSEYDYDEIDPNYEYNEDGDEDDWDEDWDDED